MQYESNLELLKNTFNRCSVNFEVFSREELANKVKENQGDEGFISAVFNELYTAILENIKPKTLFKFIDNLKLNYYFLQAGNFDNSPILLIGPLLFTTPSSSNILHVFEKNNLLPKHKNLLLEYLSLVPIIDPESHLFTMLEVYCESIWGKNYNIRKLLQDKFTFSKNINSLLEKQDEKMDEKGMHLLKQKYDVENQILLMVELGQTEKLKKSFSNLSTLSLKKRLSDHLRDTKNYCIIANTLLRKSAEKGGVHPYYLDVTASNYATIIENTHNLNDCVKLIKEMFFTYCQMVSELSTKQYSPVVEGSIIYIMNHLSDQLTLSTIAKTQNVSKQYLSAVFKKDTKKTITQFITERRIAHAITLLTTTKLKIESISQHCGIFDIQYFCKLFKKATGKSPKEYRQ